MEMRSASVLGLSALMVLAGVGCNKVSKDNSKVIANVAGEKITEKGFGEMVRTIAGDDAKAKELLTNDTLREQRNQFLEQMATQKAVLAFAKAEGLDKDAKVQAAIENATAMAYFQAMVEKRSAKLEPTEADLHAFYDDFVKEKAASGNKEPMPPFEQVKAQLPMAWKRKQGQKATEGLLTAVRVKYPMTFAPEYKASQAR
jgi:ATP-dependent DNA ligase